MVILAAVDVDREQDPVVTVAHDLASAYETKLYVLHVATEDEFRSHQRSVQEIDDFQEYSKAQHSESAAKKARTVVKETLDETDGRVETIGRVGDPVQSILGAAEELDAQYVVIGGRKRSPTGKVLFGSTTQSVMLAADRPIVTVMRNE